MHDLPEAWQPQPPKPAKAKASPRKATKEAGGLPGIELEHSKVLRRLRYDEAGRALIVEFRNGHVYRYFGVSRDDYTKLATAKSPGARFNQDIQPYHEFEQLE